jgi:two-component system, chemotaxis family, sensor kinase CheA
LDHGLELPEVRAAHGKPEEGRINLEISSNGGTVVLNLRDDGAGVNREAVLRRALERGLISDVTGVHPDAALELIFEPGFSTAAQVSETSGRGVGMDVVRENVRQLGGTVSLSSQPGAGTSFTLRVPAQLATTRVLLMRLSDQTLAIPTVHVERTGRVLAEEIVSVSGHQVVSLDGQTVPLAELGDLLDAPFDRLETWQPYAVIRTQDALLACAVDALLDEREVVVKRLGYPLNLLTHISGAAVLGGGTLVPILSVQAVMERYQQGRTTLRRPTTPVAVVSPKRRRVLVVDDSLTSRTLERSILEAAGFETLVPVNGAEALSVLRRPDSKVDLVLSDVEMPELDGFGLTEAIRRDPQLAQIPVVLVTSLNAAEHREHGAASGADAYIVKGEFEQTVLLETINGLL